MNPRILRNQPWWLAAALVGIVAPATALAATSDSVTLGGTVASTASVEATDTATASSLPLNTASEQIVKVADISMTTNNSTGLTLTASSGDLVNADSATIAFKVVTVDDAAAAPIAGDFTIASGDNFTRSSSAAGSWLQDLYIAYTPAALQDPGAYSGTISLTVADN